MHLYEQAPLSFDDPGSSFVLVVLSPSGATSRMPLSRSGNLQTIDKSL
ncbi:hypothetical protein ACNKHL_07865 [Shigella flexneri]